jgi:hypothetical protein
MPPDRPIKNVVSSRIRVEVVRAKVVARDTIVVV